jgi:hypothetical protein
LRATGAKVYEFYMLQPAPLITSQNANQMREKAYETRVQKKNAEIAELKRQLAAALLVAQDDELRRKSLLREQMSKCDEMMAKAKDPKTFKQWVEAKARLWELLYPKPGSLRPKAGRTTAPALHPIPAPLPIEPAPALVPGDPQENHKTEIIQSQVAA